MDHPNVAVRKATDFCVLNPASLFGRQSAFARDVLGPSPGLRETVAVTPIQSPIFRPGPQATAAVLVDGENATLKGTLSRRPRTFPILKLAEYPSRTAHQEPSGPILVQGPHVVEHDPILRRAVGCHLAGRPDARHPTPKRAQPHASASTLLNRIHVAACQSFGFAVDGKGRTSEAEEPTSVRPEPHVAFPIHEQGFAHRFRFKERRPSPPDVIAGGLPIFSPRPDSCRFLPH